LGTSDIKNIEYQFAAYPNPTQGDFTVKCFSNNIKEFYYSIYDLQGKCIYKDNQKYINSFKSAALNNAAKGEYILLLTTAGKTFSTKIIKN
jgi:regulation of enolase protein 1 (concanavalin A-like superfamily)